MSIVLSSKTVNELEKFVKQPFQVLIISGKEGTGKNEVFELLTKKMSINKNNIIKIGIDSDSIGIDEIRKVKSEAKLKPVNSSNKNLSNVNIYFFNNAENITVEAQNSLLKLLEDTPKDTIFIFACNNENKLLDTLKSRSHIMRLFNPTYDEYKSNYSNKITESEINKTYVMSDGRSRIFDELINDFDSKIKNSYDVAKRLVSSNTFERLCIQDKIIKEYDLEILIFCLIQIFRSLSRVNDGEKVNKNLEKLRQLAELEQDIQTINVNKKLLLTKLCLTI